MIRVKEPVSNEAKNLWFWLLGKIDGSDVQCCNKKTNLTPFKSKWGYWTDRREGK